MQNTFNERATQLEPEGEDASKKLVPQSRQELQAKVLGSRQAVEELVATPPLASGPQDGFDKFKYESRLDQAKLAYRGDVVQLLATSPSVASLVSNNKVYQVSFKGYQGDWKVAVEDPKVTMLVKDSMAVQRAALEDVDPEGRINISPKKEQGVSQVDIPQTPPKHTTVDIDLGSLDKKTKTPGIPKTEEGHRLFAERFLGEDRISLERKKRVEATLERRKDKASSRLLEMGLTGLVKGLESFKNVNPKTKLAIGLALAGTSIATGGLTSILSKGLSIASLASSHYHEKIKALEAEGAYFDARKIAVQSLTRGVILALASSELMSYLAPHVPGALDTITEKFSSVKENVKSWFSGLSEVTPLPTSRLESMPINGLTANRLEEMPINGLSTDDGLKMNSSASLTESLSSVESLTTPSTSPLPAYTILSGDNLTKIIREHVFTTIPGVDNLTEFQKDTIIANLLQQAKENPTSPFYQTINQFTNPSMIQSGKVLDLNEIRQGIIGYHHNPFGGTLFDYAKTITGGGFVGGGSTLSSSFGSMGDSSSYIVDQGFDDDDSVPSTTPAATQQNSVPAPQENPRIQGEGFLTNA